MERITVGEVAGASRERLNPGTVIEGLTDYNQVSHFIDAFGRKLSTGKERLTVRFSSLSAQRKILIGTDDFRNSKRFWGRIKPELALIVPTALARPPRALNPEGLALLLRYRLASTGKDRIYLVECSFFREIAASLVLVFAKERESKDAMERVIGQRFPDYAERLREGLDLIFAAP